MKSGVPEGCYNSGSITLHGRTIPSATNLSTSFGIIIAVGSGGVLSVELEVGQVLRSHSHSYGNGNGLVYDALLGCWMKNSPLFSRARARA